MARKKSILIRRKCYKTLFSLPQNCDNNISYLWNTTAMRPI